MIQITALIVTKLEHYGDGCLGSIDITMDWVGTLPSWLSYAYFREIGKNLSRIDDNWSVKVANNRRVGPLTRKVHLKDTQAGNHVGLECTFYDKLLETIMQVGVKGCLNDATFPYITQLSEAFKKKLAQMLEDNPKKLGKTRQEIRIYSSCLQSTDSYE